MSREAVDAVRNELMILPNDQGPRVISEECNLGDDSSCQSNDI